MTDVPESALKKINKTIGLSEVPEYADKILKGGITGHIVVDVNG